MFYIYEVHYEEGNKRKIIAVKWTENLNNIVTKESTKQEMVSFIEANPGQVKTKYLKKYRKTDNSIVSKWVEGAYVEVIDGRYLRTDPNGNGSDNLENLPEY